MMMRLLSNGNTDNTFGNNGIYTVNSTGSVNLLNGLIVLQDQSVVACGSTQPGNNLDFLLAKVLTVTPTGIEDPAAQEDIRVYPNPAKDYFQVSFETSIELGGEIRLYDFTGKLVYQKSFDVLNSPVTVSLPENLRNGMYAVKFVSGPLQFVETIFISK